MSCRSRIDRLTAIGHVAPGVLPHATLAHDRLEHPATQRGDEPGLLGQRDELVRHDQATPRMGPAHQRLDADQLAIVAGELGLVVQHQLAVLDAMAQLAVERQAFGRVVVLLRFVARRSRRPRRLATYIATSARCSSTSASSPCWGYSATPRLPPTSRLRAIQLERLLQQFAAGGRPPTARRPRRCPAAGWRTRRHPAEPAYPRRAWRPPAAAPIRRSKASPA